MPNASRLKPPGKFLSTERKATPMNEQQSAAKDAMAAWLSHPQELGKAPVKLELAGEFDLHNLHYYIFKYKKSVLGPWLLGVCGGYEPGESQHCGHVFSEMESYDPATAKEKATAMVEKIREYWMEQARQASQEPEERKTGPFASFVLLESARWDPEKYKADLLADWGITYSQEPDEAAGDESGDSLVFDVDGMMAAVSLMPAPVPGGEAEQNAATNYLWPQAVEVTKTHQAHLLVAVLGKERCAQEIARLWVKVTAACLKQENALGVYACGTVFEPGFYLQAADTMKEGELPLLNWVYFGLYRTENGICGYTYGLNAFGKDEIEVLDTPASPGDLRDFLFDLSYYVLAQDVVLRDGETIGFSAEQKLPITRSPGVAVEGMSLKIGYPQS